MKTMTLLTLLAALAPLIAACASEPAAYHDRFREQPNRSWPGPEWYANRVQDWRLQDGRLECLTNQDRLGLRTVHLLTRRPRAAGDAPVHLEVLVATTEPGSAFSGPGLAGFLIGAGSNEIDYRLTALIQQAPAEGGGLLAVVDGSGRVLLLDFSKPQGEQGHWSLGGKLDRSALPTLAAGEPPQEAQSGPIRLCLDFTGADRGLLELVASSGGKPISRLTLGDFERERLSGGLALVSDLGPEGSPHGFAFSDVSLTGADAYPERAFGPILGVQYTVTRRPDGSHLLKLNAQAAVLGGDGDRDAHLELRPRGGSWRRVQTSRVMDDSCVARFRIEEWDAGRRTDFRVVLAGSEYPGVIRAEPEPDRPLVLASLGGIKNYTGGLKWTHDGLWFPHQDVMAHIRKHDPDLLFFSGDQIYEGDVSPPDFSSDRNTLLDYHTKWQRFLWAFGELTRDRPAVTVPDDHDVFHGNLWGAGGVRAIARDGLSAQDAGGYKLPAWLVNAIHETQTGHLPDPVIAGPIGQGIYPYTTRLLYGGLDCAILSDRMWKDSASVLVKDGRVVNGFFQEDGFDPRKADVTGAELLGPQQEAFLGDWAADRDERSWMKLVLSQSPFTCVHTLPAPARTDQVVPSLKVPHPGEYPESDVPVLDADSNGWPQSARNRALQALRTARALHLAGDQHLSTVVRYGIDKWGDGTIVFTSPAVGNTWPRRWMPAKPGANQEPGAPRYTGDYLDGFMNRITVLAVANPLVTGRQPARLLDRSPGYAIVRFDPQARQYTLEAWPRWADPAHPEQMFPGWPITFDMER
ncbi:MAG: alkaline phosphatase D family protein [Planctomycetota bacterium]